MVHNGEYYGVANLCPHQLGPLCEGELNGQIRVDEADDTLVYDEEKFIRCPWHNWTFDITTGENIAYSGYMIPTYDVIKEDEKLFVVK